MVSKASEDFPLPLGPVTTVNFPSVRSRSTPLRLFWRAPRISMQPRSAGTVTQSFPSTFEPTGNYFRMRSPSQISIAALRRNTRPQDERTGLCSEARLDLFVLCKKRRWHVFAEGFEKL